jgi:hypothetical protein
MSSKDEIFIKLYNKCIEILKEYDNIEIPKILNHEIFKIYLITQNVKSINDLINSDLYNNETIDKLDIKDKNKIESLIEGMITLIN